MIKQSIFQTVVLVSDILLHFLQAHKHKQEILNCPSILPPAPQFLESSLNNTPSETRLPDTRKLQDPPNITRNNYPIRN